MLSRVSARAHTYVHARTHAHTHTSGRGLGKTQAQKIQALYAGAGTAPSLPPSLPPSVCVPVIPQATPTPLPLILTVSDAKIEIISVLMETFPGVVVQNEERRFVLRTVDPGVQDCHFWL